MPGNHADIERCIQDAAGALHPQARLTPGAHPIAESRPALLLVTVSSCPEGLIEVTPACQHNRCGHSRRGRRGQLGIDAE
jgi:hypothetical protein